jgi:hypothetical protein
MTALPVESHLYLVKFQQRIAVGTRIAARPPHKTERAPFRHSASTLGV